MRLATLAAFAWLTLAVLPGRADAIVSDAGCPGPADDTISALGDEREAQTFTALHTGALTRASIEVNKGSLLQQGDFVLQILEVGAGGVPTDTALASAAIPDASVPQGGAVIDVAFSNPPTVAAGHGYAIAIGRPGGLTTFSVHTRSGNPCGGEIFHNTGDGWGREPTDADFVFRTYVNPSNQFGLVGRDGKLFARVPGPGSIVVDDVSTVPRSAAVTSRKKKKRKKRRRGRLVQRTTATAQTAGDVEIHLKLTKRGVRKIVKRRKFDLPVAITYTPTGGDPNTKTFSIKIRL